MVVAQRPEEVLVAMMDIQESSELSNSIALLRRQDDSAQFDLYPLEKGQEIVQIRQLPETHPLIVHLDSLHNNVIPNDQIPSELQEGLRGIGGSRRGVSLCIHSFKELKAIFFIGQRVSEDPYQLKDLALFEVIANQAIIIFERITQNKKLRDQSNRLENLNTQLQAINTELEEKVQEAVALAQKHFHQAAFSTLASGLAHEIRNPMGVVQGNAGLLAEDLGGVRTDDRIGGLKWERRVNVSDFVPIVDGNVAIAESIYNRLVETNILSPGGQFTDRIEWGFPDLSRIELGPEFSAVSDRVTYYLMTLGRLQMVFDFINVVEEQMP
ncbi:hypothetical protein EBR96_05585, partial [bacterium]|nr:hypothetical protein [bacterium]